MSAAAPSKDAEGIREGVDRRQTPAANSKSTDPHQREVRRRALKLVTYSREIKEIANTIGPKQWEIKDLRRVTVSGRARCRTKSGGARSKGIKCSESQCVLMGVQLARAEIGAERNGKSQSHTEKKKGRE